MRRPGLHRPRPRRFAVLGLAFWIGSMAAPDSSPAAPDAPQGAPDVSRAAADAARAAPALAPLSEEPYQEVRVFLPPGKTIADLLSFHPDLELMGLGEGDLRLLSRPSITQALRARGWRLTIIHEDLQAHYASLQKAGDNFGIFHTYSETIGEMNVIHEQFPEITTAPFSIGLSVEGRDLWAIKISDHPELDEEEPEVLFDGVHHAREIMTVEILLYFLRYLCEHYGTDALATHLVDKREIYFVPVVNPDGFVFNEQIAPGGGGMWRKNRRVNAGGSFGVDNNRNYPFRWGLGSGSSSVPSNETYRGPSPASEPETQAMMAFIEGRHFVTQNSFHSFLGAVLMPWCYTDEVAPDDSILRSIAAGMTAESGYRFGQCPEVLYLVSGGLIDWAYGERNAKGKIYSFSTEVGGSGFWPDPSERDGLIAENIPSMLFLAEAAGPGVSAEISALADEGGDGRFGPGETVEVGFLVTNEGVLSTLGGVEIRLSSDDPYALLERTRLQLGEIPPAGSVDTAEDPLRLRIDPSCPDGRRIELTARVVAGGAVEIALPIAIDVGTTPALYTNSFESEADAWILDESHTAAAGAFERIVPAETPYQPGDDTTLPPGTYAWVSGQNVSEGEGDVDDGIAASRSPDLDLSGVTRAQLMMRYFHGQRDGGDDPQGDFFAIEASSDAGASWVPLVSIGDEPSLAVWRDLEIDLEKVIDLTDRVRLRVRAADGPADGDIIEAGIDDVRLTASDLSDEKPLRPSPLTPAEGAVVSARPAFAILYPYESPGALRCGFRVFADSDQTQLVASADGIERDGNVVSWRPDQSLAPGTYVWRAFAENDAQRGLYSQVVRFTVDDSIPVEEEPPPLAGGLVALPNPAGDRVRIRAAVPPARSSALAIFDASGRRLRGLDLPPSVSGWTEITWDGRDDAGRKVASGPYWVRLTTPEATRTIQLVRLR